jgi:hypothetical protein
MQHPKDQTSDLWLYAWRHARNVNGQRCACATRQRHTSDLLGEKLRGHVVWGAHHLPVGPCAGSGEYEWRALSYPASLASIAHRCGEVHGGLEHPRDAQVAHLRVQTVSIALAVRQGGDRPTRLDDVFLGEEDVLRLEVAVQDVAAVQVLDGEGNLVRVEREGGECVARAHTRA